MIYTVINEQRLELLYLMHNSLCLQLVLRSRRCNDVLDESYHSCLFEFFFVGFDQDFLSGADRVKKSRVAGSLRPAHSHQTGPTSQWRILWIYMYFKK